MHFQLGKTTLVYIVISLMVTFTLVYLFVDLSKIVLFVIVLVCLLLKLFLINFFHSYSDKSLSKEILELGKAALHLKDITKQVFTGSQQVSDAVNQITSGAKSQSEQIKAISELLITMSSSTQQVATTISAVADLSNKSSQSAQIAGEAGEKSIASLVIDIENGARIFSAGVIVHIGSHMGAGFDSVKDQLVAVIQRILGETQNCDLILENAAGQNGKIGSLSELAYLLKKVNDPRLKVCLDTAHLFAAGVDLRSLSAIKELTLELRDLNLLDRLVCLHLNDCASDLDSHRDLHANIGEGKIGLEGLRLFINQKELLHLPLILEVPGDNKQGPNLKNISLVRGTTS